MSINSILKTALAPVAPAEADVYEGKKSVYITFNYDTYRAISATTNRNMSAY